jgi:hypothetical protein
LKLKRGQELASVLGRSDPSSAALHMGYGCGSDLIFGKEVVDGHSVELLQHGTEGQDVSSADNADQTMPMQCG